jgi:hypothetical protein
MWADRLLAAGRVAIGSAGLFVIALAIATLFPVTLPKYAVEGTIVGVSTIAAIARLFFSVRAYSDYVRTLECY